MHDDDKLKLARAIVKAHYPEMKPSYNGRRVQIALAAINALDPQLVEAVGLLRGIVDDYQSSEIHHPDHILISKDVFDRISAFLAKQGDA